MSNFSDALKNDHQDFSKNQLDNVSTQAPHALFTEWLQQAYDQKVIEPNAMTVSTINNGIPESRVVYLRDFVGESLVFYTNYNSAKAQAIKDNPIISLLFFWPELERQIRIHGHCEQVDHEISDEYFAQRPRKSQIGAWASQQSDKITDRKALEEAFQKTEERFKDQDIQRPEHWGGYAVKPSYYEFWQGRPGRLHDRVCFEKNNETWKSFRLNP